MNDKELKVYKVLIPVVYFLLLLTIIATFLI